VNLPRFPGMGLPLWGLAATVLMLLVLLVVVGLSGLQ
jgi:hypothetical protein